MFIWRDFIPFGHVLSYLSVLGVYHLSHYPIYCLRGSVRWPPCPNLLSVALSCGQSLSLHSSLLVLPLLGLLASWSSAWRPCSSPHATCSSCAPSSLSRPPGSPFGRSRSLSLCLALVLLLPCLRNPPAFNALRSWIHVCLVNLYSDHPWEFGGPHHDINFQAYKKITSLSHM